MDNEILKRAEKKLRELFGEQIPVEILNRYETEKRIIGDEELLVWMDFLGDLSEQVAETDGFVTNTDPRFSASFIAWLLGGNDISPLPAYYYCPNCRKVEFIPNVRCGYDAPDKVCSCGTAYEKNGFGIDPIQINPIVGGAQIRISSGTKGIVKDRFHNYFGKYGVVRQVRFSDDEECMTGSKEYYAVIPNDKAADYPEEVLATSWTEFSNKFHKVHLLSVELEIDQILLHEWNLKNDSLADIRGYIKYAVDKGFFRNEETDMSEVVRNLSDPSFSDLIDVYGIMTGSGTWKENGEILYANGAALAELISNRDDVHEYLYDKIKDSKKAYEIKERLRKGIYSVKGMPDEVEVLLKESGVENWYVESMKKIHYLTSKAHIVTCLKIDIAKYLAESTNF